MSTRRKKHVILTGASGGIGSYLVSELLSEGYSVTAMDQSEAGLAELVGRAPGELFAVKVDVTDSADVERALTASVDAFGVPWGLVNLAGNNILKPLPELTDNDWRVMLDVNLTSAFYLCRAVMPLMAKNGEGRVVNTSSIFGIRGADYDAGYAAAKAGVVGLTRALATEYARHNVTVNNIAPVVVLTERVKKMPQEHLAGQLARIPLGRFSELADVARTFVFLLGPDGSFYTGQTFSPNGGDLMP